MKIFFKLLVAGFIGLVLLYLYPSFLTMVNYYTFAASIIPGYTLGGIDKLLFDTVPLLALFAVFYIMWAIVNKRIRLG